MSKTFGKKLQSLREEQGLYQKDIAAELHISRQAVTSWETDAREPDFDTLIKLCDLLETDPNTLLDYEPRKKN
ncbi:hypothetical protein FACS1894211_10150 [Clostridia bacterium]|nr:hypothetical protein FACS1894211_10150 [Clostridia bacterium]